MYCSQACAKIGISTRKQKERREAEEIFSRETPPPSECRWIAVASGNKRFVFSLVDEAVFEAASMILWQLSNKGYAFTRNTPDKSTIHLHHIAFGEKPSAFEIDHVNRVPLDNRRSNLRPATHAQNMQNMIPRPNSEGFIGIRKQRGMEAWIARITVEGRRFYLGQFLTPEEAAHAYDEAALRLHGVFAKLNFPLEKS